MNYFKDAIEVADIKYVYRQLAMKYHPDRPDGSTEIMQIINEQYQQALKHANGQRSCNSDGREFTYHYNADIESSVVEMLDVLLSIKMPNVDINLIGCWLWLTGNTRLFKEDLKAIGCRWHAKRQAWYWHDPKYRSSFRSRDSLSELAMKYGVKTFTEKAQQAQLNHH